MSKAASLLELRTVPSGLRESESTCDTRLGIKREQQSEQNYLISYAKILLREKLCSVKTLSESRDLAHYHLHHFETELLGNEANISVLFMVQINDFPLFNRECTIIIVREQLIEMDQARPLKDLKQEKGVK